MSVSDLNDILTNLGRHAMLSRLTSLSFRSLKTLEEEADNIVIQTDPSYTAAYLIQSFTQHILRARIDTTAEHDRHFLKFSFLNKGIDFIDLPSIFRETISKTLRFQLFAINIKRLSEISYSIITKLSPT
jgi:hypothetical protein